MKVTSIAFRRDGCHFHTRTLGGLADDNVVAAHTLRLSAALLAAGRPHEVLPLPTATHSVSDVAVVENMLWHQLDFLRRALGLSDLPATKQRVARDSAGAQR
jgi:hypothetical protein